MDPDDYEECVCCGLEFPWDDLVEGLCDECLAEDDDA